MRVRFALTLAIALAAVLTAGTAIAQPSVTDPVTEPVDIVIGHPRAAVLTVYHSGAESFLLLGPGSRDAPLQPALRDGAIRLAADYEALFMPLTAGWARYKLEAWLIVDGERELLDEDLAQIVDFGPSRHGGRLALRLRLEPGLHQIHLIATTQARAVGVPEWTTDIDAATVWVLIPGASAQATLRDTHSANDGQLQLVSNSLASALVDPAPAPNPSLPLGGLGVGSHRAVAATTAVGALNFPTGHNRTLVVRVGEKVHVWSDYELWWTELAQAEAAAALIVTHRPTVDDARSAEIARADYVLDDATGPRLEDGNLHVAFKFDREGLYHLAATLHTGVRSGNERSVDEDVVPFTVKVIATQPPVGAIAGRVIAEDGSPLEGVKVEATDVHGRPAGEARSNADGHYLIEKLTPGDYRVHAIPGDLNFLDEWWKDSPSVHGSALVAVKANTTTTGISFVLTAGGTIAGRVVDGAGHPLGGIEIAVGYLRSEEGSRTPVDPDMTNATIARTKTNDEGYYSIDRLRPNAYWVRANDPRGRYRTEYFDDKLVFANADKVWVKSGATTDGINFELASGGSIVGRVVGVTASGLETPLAGVTVEARSAESPDHVIGSAVTNRDGVYRIGSLRPGRYFVRAFDKAGKYSQEWFKEAASLSDAEPVPVEAGETTDGVNFTLEPRPDKTVVFIDPSRLGVTVGASGKLHVTVAGVENLGAFETSVAWNPEIIRVDEVILGEFLGSTGREVIAMEPMIDNDRGWLEFGAATIGERRGPDGRGVLFSIRFTALAVGETGVEIDNSVLTHPSAVPIEHLVHHGRVVVGECMFGDFDCNCVIDIRDVMEVVSRWGTKEGDPDYDPKFDLDDDGDIDIVDVQIETGLWGRRCDDASPEPVEPIVVRPGAVLDGVGDPVRLDSGPGLVLSTVPESAAVGETITVVVDIVDAVDLAGFDLWLKYDAERLSFVGAELGDFLGSTGRSVFPLGPNQENGSVGFGAFSMPGVPAPAGAGRVAEFTFDVVSAGQSTLAISEATTVDSRQESSPAGGSSATFEGRGEGSAADVYVPYVTRR